METNSTNNKLIVIVGATAIGKTALGIKLAQHFDCEIVSADSRQFFKEMKIGTAVPDEAELTAVQHHFIQNKSIFEPYSVGNFEQEAIEKLEELFIKNPIQTVVGGSGLYVDALLKGFDDFPEIDPEIRAKINAEYDEKGIEYLQKQLQLYDPEYYLKLQSENPQTLQNQQRMKRFVEVCLGTETPYSQFIGRKKNKRNFTPVLIGLEAERETMYDRINRRVDIMIENGLLKEAEMLYPYKYLNALQTVGYRELFEYFDGRIVLDTAIEQIKQNTRRFAKRQLTWFKRNSEIQWFDYKEDVKKIISYIKK